MDISKIDEKIAEQQGIIIEANARLEAWIEVRDDLQGETIGYVIPTKVRKKRYLAKAKTKKSPQGETLMPHVYNVLEKTEGKFTSTDITDAILKQVKIQGSRSALLTTVCSYLHSATSGKIKQPRYHIKVCGKRGKLKLYELGR